jgi:hypothetical protein
MAMQHRGQLADHAAVIDRGNEIVARRCEIDPKAIAIDGVIEHAVRDAVEQGRIVWAKAPDLNGHRPAL